MGGMKSGVNGSLTHTSTDLGKQGSGVFDRAGMNMFDIAGRPRKS
jgi:hypothetical protein